MKKLLASLTLASVFAALATMPACESAPSRRPRQTQKVALTADRIAPDVEADVVNAVEIDLPPGPAGSAGYVWVITSGNVRVLPQMGPLKPGPAGDPSVAPAATVTFYAAQPGRSVLRFALVRPADAEAIPAAKCQVTVVVSE